MSTIYILDGDDVVALDDIVYERAGCGFERPVLGYDQDGVPYLITLGKFEPDNTKVDFSKYGQVKQLPIQVVEELDFGKIESLDVTLKMGA